MSKRIDQARDTLPIQLQSRANDELLVCDRLPAFKGDLVVLRLKGSYSAIDVYNPARHHGRHWTNRGFRTKHAGAHHGPSRLVAMTVGGLNDGYVETAVAGQ